MKPIDENSADEILESILRKRELQNQACTTDMNSIDNHTYFGGIFKKKKLRQHVASRFAE